MEKKKKLATERRAPSGGIKEKIKWVSLSDVARTADYPHMKKHDPGGLILFGKHLVKKKWFFTGRSMGGRRNLNKERRPYRRRGRKMTSKKEGVQKKHPKKSPRLHVWRVMRNRILSPVIPQQIVSKPFRRGVPPGSTRENRVLIIRDSGSTKKNGYRRPPPSKQNLSIEKGEKHGRTSATTAKPPNLLHEGQQ